MSLRKNEWWMVINPDGYFVCWAADTTRRGAIRQFIARQGFDVTQWQSLWNCEKATGYRCVKCKIEESSE